MRVWLALACMLIFCEGCRGGIVGKYKCYPKYTKDELQQMKTRGDKAICESKPGFKYTRGNDALAPGCGHCWCCQPLQPVVGKYKCYPKYTKDELQQMKTRGDKAVCESKPGFKYTRGNDALAPGCGHCWCCQPVQPDAFTNQRALADFKQPPYHLGSGVQGALQSNGDFIFQVPDPVNRKMIRTTNLGVTVKIGFLPVQTTTWTNSNSWNYAPKGFYQLKHFRAYNKDDAFHQAAYADFWQPPHHLGTDVKGVCLPNGDFIFQVFGPVYRKMVRTTNSGVTVKIGYLPTKSETWTNSDSWTDDMPNGFYQIKNFQDKTMNLAEGKQATQSPNYHHYVSATNAVDGNTGTNYVNDKCTHTSDRSETRWWMVDLEKPSSIEKVTLFNRMDCCSERLNNAEVYVMDSPTEMNKQKCGKVDSARGRAKIDIPCIPGVLYGRYVRVEIPSGILTLCEVQVWGKEQSCAPQKIVFPELKPTTSEEVSKRMTTSFAALEENGGSSDLVSRWKHEKRKCFDDVACKNDLNENTVNVNRVAYGLEAGDDITTGLTYMKSEAKLKHTLLGLVGKIGPYLGAMGAVASIISSFGTSPEMQKLNQIINVVGEGFNQMEDRFDKLEAGLDELGSEMEDGFFQRSIIPELKKLNLADNDVKEYFEATNETERKVLVLAFTRDSQVTKLRSALNSLVNIITGEITSKTACSKLISAFVGDRRMIVDRLVRIYTRILKGVTHLKVIMDATKQKDTQIRMDSLKKELKEIAAEIIKCDERLKGEWEGRWKTDLTDLVIDFKDIGGKEKELADAIYNKLSGKYYWRHWLVYVYSNYDDDTVGRDHFIHIQADHSYHKVEGRYRILVTSIPEDAPVTTWTDIIAPMRKDIIQRYNTRTPAMGAKDIFYGLPTGARSKPIAAVTLEGSKNCNYCNFGLRAPKERKFHQHFTSVCHDLMCGQKSFTSAFFRSNPLYQTRRYQIVILG